MPQKRKACVTTRCPLVFIGLYSSGSRIWSPSFRDPLLHMVSACGLRCSSQHASLPGPVDAWCSSVGIPGSGVEGGDYFPPWWSRGKCKLAAPMVTAWRREWGQPVGLRGREEQGFAFCMCFQTTFLCGGLGDLKNGARNILSKKIIFNGLERWFSIHLQMGKKEMPNEFWGLNFV